MKILLVGPYPPPHGGVSVHVYEARRRLSQAGIECQVVNLDPRARQSDEYIAIRGGCDLFSTLARFASQGWILHVHANGHSHKNWLVALTAGLAAGFGPGGVLTLHSGMTPAHLAHGNTAARLLARTVCSLYQRVIAVAPEIQRVILSLGCAASSVELLPAYLECAPSLFMVPQLYAYENRRPLLVSTLFFRREYGFDLLLEAVDRLRLVHPKLVCLVMGSGEQRKQAEDKIAERGLQRHIVLLGNVAHDVCLTIMSQADVMVRPALADGDANSVREALSLGVPVVASDVGHRPAGTVLFRTGHAGDLSEKLSETIAAGRGPRSVEDSSSGSVHALIDVYSSLRKTPYAAPGKTQWEH